MSKSPKDSLSTRLLKTYKPKTTHQITNLTKEATMTGQDKQHHGKTPEETALAENGNCSKDGHQQREEQV